VPKEINRIGHNLSDSLLYSTDYPKRKNMLRMRVSTWPSVIVRMKMCKSDQNIFISWKSYIGNKKATDVVLLHQISS